MASMKEVCFWTIQNRWEDGATEEVKSHIVPDWNQTLAAKACINFMSNADPIVFYKGCAMCRICGTPLGSQDFARDGYVFPQGWEHYIIAHSVKPWDEEFITAALANTQPA